MLPIRTILHPTDFSASSNFAFRVACSLAREHGAQLVILHVFTPPALIYAEGTIPPSREDFQTPLLEQLHQIQPRDPRVAVTHQLVEGNAANEILRSADETHCDLIVMGTHGRTGLAHLFMGSLAERIVRRAACPVLIVKPPLRNSANRETAADTVAELAGTAQE